VGDHPRDRSSKSITAVESAQPPVRRRGEACVVVLYGPELGRRATLGRGAFQIGRSSKNELPIDQESVSRHHARITHAPSRGYTIEDLGSTNGTYLNDEKVGKERRPLKDGDQIRVGRSILKFMTGTNLEANYHEEIYRLMTVDALTQVYNKRYFNEALEREYNRAHRYKRELSLVIFDVDHFKEVNDVNGHLAGDAILRQVAAEVKPRLREQDIFARVGGEEFALLLPEIGHPGAIVTGEKVRKIVEGATFTFEAVVVTVTVSVGITSLDERGRDSTSLYERADAALYDAKANGRNCVRSG
jgi:two-component system cell cycle response regulator